MKICIINGSPRRKNSNSAILIDYLNDMLKTQTLCTHYCSKESDYENIEKDISDANAIILAFPLYIDSIPSSTLNFLRHIEEKKIVKPQTRLYCIVNNGFYEGTQNKPAVNMIKLWSKKIDATWGQGIGVGSGEMIKALKNVPLGKGPTKNLSNALTILSKNILENKTDEDIFFNPNWPRFLWMIQANLSFFITASKNKLSLWKILKKH